MVNYLDIHPNTLLDAFNNIDNKLKIQTGKEVWKNLIKYYIQQKINGDENMDNKFKVDREILIFAFRYALGRMTYAPYTVMDNIKTNIKDISTEDIELYLKEINECNNYGMEMDSQCWLNFKDYLQNILNQRTLNQK